MAKHAQHDDHAPNVKLYMLVFAALMVLTVVTVWISKFHLDIHKAIALGLFVAGIKATLVAAVFMHLWGEKKLIFAALGLTFAFGALLVIGLIDSRLVDHQTTLRVNVKEQQPGHGAHGDAHPAPSMEPAKKGAH